MAEVIKVGPMGEQSRSIHEVICDSELLQIVIVSLCEEMPTVESCELYSRLHADFNKSTSVLLNRWVKIPPKHPKNSESKSLNEFINYLDILNERQQVALRSFNELKIPVKIQDLIFEVTPKNVIEVMSAQMEAR